MWVSFAPPLIDFIGLDEGVERQTYCKFKLSVAQLHCRKYRIHQTPFSFHVRQSEVFLSVTADFNGILQALGKLVVRLIVLLNLKGAVIPPLGKAPALLGIFFLGDLAFPARNPSTDPAWPIYNGRCTA